MSRRRCTMTAALAGSVILAAAAPVAAGGGFEAVRVLRTADPGTEIRVADIAARNRAVVVGWQENAPGGGRAVYLRWSTDTGATFRPRVRLDTRRQREVSVDTCGGWAWAASALRESGDWLVALDKRALAGSEFESSVLTLDGVARRPDVACAGPRLVVVWFQKVGATWRVKLHARGVADQAKGDSLPPISLDLGLGEEARGLTIAATASDVYVAWFQGDDLKLRHFQLGAGPDYDLLGVPTVGMPSMPDGFGPRLGAAGARVVLAYTNEADLRARVSGDSGVSFGPERTLLDAPFPSEVAATPSTADILGSHILVGGSVVGGIFDELTGEGFLYRTTNGGASWSRVPGTTKDGGAAVGAYAGKVSSRRIVEAWDRWIADPATDRLRFQREG